MEKKRDLILFPWFLDVYIKPLIPSISTNRKQTMHDVYFCPLKSAGTGSTWYTKASKSPISLWNPGKTLLGNPQPSICKTNGELLLIWVGWWFGMRGGVPWKKQQSLKTWGDLRDPNHQTQQTLNP